MGQKKQADSIDQFRVRALNLILGYGASRHVAGMIPGECSGTQRTKK